MEDSQEKDYSFFGNGTFPKLYDALVYERKFKSEYLERQIYERLLKSEPSIVKLIENKNPKKRATKPNRAEFNTFIQSRVSLGPGKFHVVFLVAI